MKKWQLGVFIVLIMIVFFVPQKAVQALSGGISCTYTIGIPDPSGEVHNVDITYNVGSKVTGTGHGDKNIEVSFSGYSLYADAMNVMFGDRHDPNSAYYGTVTETIGSYYFENSSKNSWSCPTISVFVGAASGLVEFVSIGKAGEFIAEGPTVFGDVSGKVNSVDNPQVTTPTPVPPATDDKILTCYYGGRHDWYFATVNVTKGTYSVFTRNRVLVSSRTANYSSCNDLKVCSKGSNKEAFITGTDLSDEYVNIVSSGYVCIDYKNISYDDLQLTDQDGNKVDSDEATGITPGDSSGESGTIGSEDVLSCQEVLGDAIEYVDWGMTLIRIAAPILLIIFGSVDFAKAVISSDQDVLKKSTSSFIKRAIAAIAIFFVPLIVQLLINASGLGSKIPDILCGL